MKRLILVLFALLALATLAAGCTVTPVSLTPAQTPTATPAGGNWQKITESGTLVVGTSADYPPFSYYDDTFRLTGFDPTLARELADRLGLDVQVRDIPFEGLTDALKTGLIDMAISAISVTPERSTQVDFTDVYFVSEDAFLANAEADVNNLNTLAEVETRALIGVQEGSVYQAWAQRELVDKGVIPASNLLLYTDVERAVRDLERKRIDLVILDLIPAQRFAESGDVKIVAQGLNRQRYAMAVPLGANDLRRNLNTALEEVRSDGTLSTLALDFLGVQAGDLPTPVATATTTPTPTPLPTSLPTSTRVPPTRTPIPLPPTATPIPVPTRCLDSMAYVADLNFDDQNMANPPILLPGQSFIKSWRVRNTGSCTWDNTYRLAFVRGNISGAQMSGQPVYINGRVRPGELYDIHLPLIAPITPGTYQGFWQLYNDLNQPFGQRVWVGIRVLPPITATPRPTQTPAPEIFFSADRTNIRAGEPVGFSWQVRNVREVYFYREGQNWWDHGVAGDGSRTEYPQRTISYFLRVVKRDNSVEQREIRIYVEAVPDAPQIAQFSVVPEGQITLGQCVQVNWDVRGDVNDVDLSRNGTDIWADAPIRAQLQDCPPSVGGYEYRIEAQGRGGVSVATRYVEVVRPAPATPTATPSPTTVPPAVVEQFLIDPRQIELGQCLNVVWAVGGDPALIQIRRNGQILFDNAPYFGNGQDCPPLGGSYLYRIEVTDRSGRLSDAREEMVNVTGQPTPTQTPVPTTTPEAQPPVIDFFTLSAEQITLGECVTLSWSYSGSDIAAASLLRLDEKLMGDPPPQGDLIDCPPTPGDYLYRLQVSSEFAGTTQAERALFVSPAPEPR